MASLELANKVAIITGAAGGIGSETAREFAEHGARVVLASRKEENLNRVAESLSKGGAETLVVPTDVTQPDDVKNLAAQTMDRFGRIDVLVNNSGGALHIKLPEELTYEEWLAGIDLNLNSVFLCTKVIGEIMVKQQHGAIINISSVAGIKYTPRFIHYGAAKAGVISLTKTFAAAWGKHHITVNCIAPGLIATPGIKKSGMLPPSTDTNGNPLGPLEIPFEPDRVAHLAVFLASPAAERISGETYPIRSLVAFDR